MVSYLFIASALVVVTLAGEAARQPLLYILLASGALLFLAGQDLVPRWVLGRWRPAVEAGIVLGFLTLLIILTGGHASPFFLGYLLLLAGASLWGQGMGPAILAAAAMATYLIGVVVAPGGLPEAAWGQVGFNLVVLALTSYVAAVIGHEQRRAHEAALRLSRTDTLTELYSRSHFVAALDQEILRSARTGRQFSLLMIDLDGLKPVNDRFGHESGDRLLRGVADVIRGDTRATDVAARYGGDEFMVILPETDPDGAILVAEKLRRDIGQLALPEDGQLIRSSVSIGVVSHPGDGRTAPELLRRVDAAMYEAKRRGRDQIVRYRPIAERQPPVPVGPSRQPEAVAGSPPQPWQREAGGATVPPVPTGPIPPGAAAPTPAEGEFEVR